MEEVALRVETGVGDAMDVVDVAVTVTSDHTVGDLAVAVAAFVGWPTSGDFVIRRGGVTIGVDPGDTVVGSGVVSGSTIAFSDAVRLTGAVAGAALDGSARGGDALHVDVIGGPDTGRSHRLGRPGRHPVGRDPAAVLRVDDPSVSRRHAVLVVDDAGAVVLEPVSGALNGVTVGGAEVVGPTPLTEHDVVRLGGTRIVVRTDVVAEASVPRSAVDLDVRPGPYRRPRVEPSGVEAFGPVPERHEGRRMPIVSIIAPLLLGVVMYAVFRHLQFLVLVLVSPVLVVASIVEDRRSGRRDLRRRLAAFEDDLAAHCERLSDACEHERRVRESAAPDLADLVRRVRSRSPTLWQRRTTDVDVLVVRLGVGRVPVSFPIEICGGGADDLRESARSSVSRFDHVEAPVAVDLRDRGVVVLAGPREVVEGLAVSVLLQVAVLTGPGAVSFAGLVRPGPAFDWLDWLPHVRRSGASLLDAPLVREAHRASGLFDRVIEVTGPAGGERSGLVVVVVDGSLEPDVSGSGRFLDAVPGSRAVVLWLAPDGADVPHQARTVVSTDRSSNGGAGARIWSVEHGTFEHEFEPETVGMGVADEVARSLAPLRDVAGCAGPAMIPDGVDLVDVLGLAGFDTSRVRSAVLDRWTGGRASGLRVPVGVGADGPVVVDLVADGPHMLVAGTSGSGKSEFLQSLVVSLAAWHPPGRVAVLLVDYKGGATADVLGSLPHVVGTVSNLTPGLARRVLVSLRAELERRMALLRGRAPDLDQLRLLDPTATPPSLVVVIDEFATLITELPEFVSGLIDIARRGRSLGVHLVLATQRPSGAVTGEILANTGLRIGLRMLDRTESSTILGTSVAATFDRCGRALLARGVGRPVEFQSAHAGAPWCASGRPVGVHALRDTGRTLDRGPSVAGTDTQLGCVVEVIADAATGFAPAPPFRPWCDPLPSQLDLGPLLARRLPDSGWPVVVGVLDEPTLQRQRPAVVDLDQGLLVVGAKGAGVSTTIRTLVAAAQVGGTDAGVVVLDGRPSHLDGLEAARVVEAVVPAGDVECLTRWIVALEDEATQRRRLRSTDEAHRCRILLVIHGFDAVIGSLVDGGGGLRSGSPAGDAWVERLVRLVVDGSDIGISAVVTATRRGDVPVRVESALARRLVLRTTEPSAWADHGLVAADVHDLVPGRGHLLGPDEGPVLVQVARTDPSGIPAAHPTGGRFRVRSRRLPDLPPPIVVPACPESATVVLGVADVSGEPVRVDVDRADFVVVGPAGSGRSTTLAVVAAQLAARSSGCPVRLFGRVSGALASIADRPDVRVAADGDHDPGVVVVDDVDRLDPAIVDVGALAGRGDVRLIGAVDVGAMSGFHPNPLVARLRRARRMLVLAPDDPAEFLQVTGVRWPVRPGLTFPPGRGVLLVDRRPVVVHVGAVPSVQSTR